MLTTILLIIFYDPANLASVAKGEMQPYQPQPYTTMPLNSYLFNPMPMSLYLPEIPAGQQKHFLGGCAFDRVNHYLYIVELHGDGEYPLIHVWRVGNPT